MSAMAPLEKLRIADPDTYVWVKGRLALLSRTPEASLLDLMVEEIIRALSQEAGLARSLAEGLIRLIDSERGGCGSSSIHIATYIEQVRQAAKTGPALGRIVADHLAPVLLAGPAMLKQFSATLAIMRSKGTYTLNEPLLVLNELLENDDHPSASAYLSLLSTAFRQQITYNRCVRLVYQIPKAVRGFVARRRLAQIEALARVVDADLQLVDPFLEGMQKGLALLGSGDLNDFLEEAFTRYRASTDAGLSFIALSSKAAQESCERMQVVVPLAQIKRPLNRYLNARLGRPVAVMAASTIPVALQADSRWICSDGRAIYMPDEIDRFECRDENRRLARVLVRLEAGYFENRTFAFDLERACDLYPEVAQRKNRWAGEPQSDKCDAQRFFSGFELPLLAGDLFLLFAQARTVAYLTHHYPGLVRAALPVLKKESQRIRGQSQGDTFMEYLYDRLVLDMTPERTPEPFANTLHHGLATELKRHLNEQAPVECCARLVCLAHDPIAARLRENGKTYVPTAVPFDRKLRWDLVAWASVDQQRQADEIKIRLAEQGLEVYRADLQERMDEQQGRLTSDDVRTLVLSRAQITGKEGPVEIDMSDPDLVRLLEKAGLDPQTGQADDGSGFRYPEWDNRLQDYLRDHVRVQESLVTARGDGDFYRQSLEHYRGMVARIRRAFEFLKPEGLVMLRQWPDGDAFDHRALIDFAVDRRAGRTPSDRLFIKRLKQERDVAALLLVDLSRSTANPVVDGTGTVLGVAKEALVLFCEALQVVGDTFAIAGFSGTGRHSVDYFRIKGFDEPLAEPVKARLSALSPQRSTRMGAAIRHATARIAPVASRVRLLIIVSDGFPNDLGYKADYAIADTRRAVQEARAKGIHVKAITVNIGSDPRLDDLYGRVHHHVIGDVRELPDKLVRLYGTLTKRF